VTSAARTVWDWRLCRACDAIQPPGHDCPSGRELEPLRLPERVGLALATGLCLAGLLAPLAAVGYGISGVV
jgi:hypothetical protein